MKTPCLLKQKLLFADCCDICYKCILYWTKKKEQRKALHIPSYEKADNHIFFACFFFRNPKQYYYYCLAFVLICRETK